MAAEPKHWDARFLALCELIGSWSEDPSRKVGSVIVGPANEIRATGFNGLARRVDATDPSRHSRTGGEKYLWFEHAERNAIFNIARSGTSSAGCRMYINHFPCADCSRAIIQTGIVSVHTYQYDSADPTFAPHYRVAEAMFQESGIAVHLFERSAKKILDALDAFIDYRATIPS